MEEAVPTSPQQIQAEDMSPIQKCTLCNTALDLKVKPPSEDLL
jgi:hypothetical protein